MIRDVVLAVDTATSRLVVGIVAGGRTVAERSSDRPRGHAEVLVPLILGCLDDAGLTRADLTAVVVGTGPGPFTGLRVGMATAAAFGHALGLPVHGVCTLDAIAADAPRGEPFCVITDARRREVYWARYDAAGRREAGPAVGPVPETGAARRAAGSPEHIANAGLAPVAPTAPTPAGLVAAADLAAEPGPFVPLYLRRPDAVPLAEQKKEIARRARAEAARRG